MPDHYLHLDRRDLHHLLLGFSSFIVLCSIKAVQLMQDDQLPEGRPLKWSEDEVHGMLDVLIEQKAKMGQASSFTLPTFNLVAKQLGTGKQASSYQTKFNAVRHSVHTL